MAALILSPPPQFDLPATLSYIRSHTGVHRLHYVGHSQSRALAIQCRCHASPATEPHALGCSAMSKCNAPNPLEPLAKASC
eukprot:1140115-Pelagomonas_calceolata.AAC.16